MVLDREMRREVEIAELEIKKIINDGYLYLNLEM